jgi:hypothetical protein
MRNFDMFTTIMYGFINEVTRQPASADIRVRARRSESPATPPRRKARRAVDTTPRHAQLAGRYRVLADSFKRAAGFY